jgi:hypothetical protein
VEEDGTMGLSSDILGNLLPGGASANKERFHKGELLFGVSKDRVTLRTMGLSVDIIKSRQGLSQVPNWESRTWRILEDAVQHHKFAKLDIDIGPRRQCPDEWMSALVNAGEVQTVVLRSHVRNVGKFIDALHDGILGETKDLEFHDMEFTEKEIRNLGQVIQLRGNGLKKITFGAGVRGQRGEQEFNNLLLMNYKGEVKVVHSQQHQCHT